MIGKRYCIICGDEIESDDPSVVFCPKHGGPAAPSLPPTHTEETSQEAEAANPVSQPITDVTQPWQPGQTLLETYEVIGELGKGGMGLVYRVHHNAWNMDLAVKQPLRSHFRTESDRENFIHEAETWVDLGLHPNITSCYYVRTIQTIPHIFVEFMAGGSLEDWIQQKNHNLYEGSREQILERILDIAIQFAWGLGYAHEQGLIHQDVKPLNVLMTSDGVAKVTDFGLANASAFLNPTTQEEAQSNGTVSARAGSPLWRSPEQANRERVSLKTDIWAWAVSVLEMFTQGVSWVGGPAAPYSLENLITTGPRPGLPEIPQTLVNLLQVCFQEDPNGRPDNLEEIAKTLIDVYHQSTGQDYPREKPNPVDLRADSLNNKALSLMDIGKEEQAVQSWEMSLKADPFHIESTYNLGLYQWSKGELTDCDILEKIGMIEDNSGDSWLSHFLLGLLHKYRKSLPAAELELKNALQQSPDNPLIKENLNSLSKLDSFLDLNQMECNTRKVKVLDFTPDGKFLVTNSDEKNIQIWDFQNDKTPRTLEGHTDRLIDVCITSDGNKIVSNSLDKTLRVWDRHSGDCIRVLKGHIWQINSFIIINDNRHIVSGSGDKTIKVWDLQQGMCLKTFRGHTDSITAIALHPDGNTIISGGSHYDNTIRFWNRRLGECYQIIKAYEMDAVKKLIFTPDGKKIISISEGLEGYDSDDHTLRVWDVSNGNCLFTLSKHKETVNDIALIPNRHEIISASDDGTLIIWDLKNGKDKSILRGHTDRVTLVQVSEDGKLAFSGGSDKTLRIWDLERAICLRTFTDFSREITRIAASSDNKHIAVAEGKFVHCIELPRDNSIQPEWIISQPEEIHKVIDTSNIVGEIKEKAKLAIDSGQFQKAGNSIRNALQIKGFERDSSLLERLHELGVKAGRIFDLLSVNKLCDLDVGTSSITALTILPDNRRIVARCQDFTLQIWDLKEGRCLYNLKTYFSLEDKILISSDGRVSILLSDWWGHHNHDNFTIFRWDMENNQPLVKLHGHTDSITALDMTSEGHRLISGSKDTTLRMWDLENGTCLLVLEKHTKPINSLKFSPDEKLFASGGRDGLLSVWDSKSGNCLHEFTGYKKSPVFSPDGQLISFLDEKNNLQIFDIKNGDSIYSSMDSEEIKLFAFTPNGKSIVTANYNQTIGVIELKAKQQLIMKEIHSDSITTLSVLHNDHLVLTGSADETIRIWDLYKGECIHVVHCQPGKIKAFTVSKDSSILIVGNDNNKLQIWKLYWDYQFPDPNKWDQTIEPYLNIFLSKHRNEESDENKPPFTDKEFGQLIDELRYCGYGWLREEDVRRRLQELAELR